jgi:hypothetical protein
LVDVPGIEGKESVVEGAITSALARSQAVFYITPDARPPQGGEEGREGTLEKMARQLKPQAKVWAIWNKKIQSPRALKKPLLVEHSDEWLSLYEGANSLDAKMREVLGVRYQTCLPVSARPAFLALATQLAPESKHAGERARFVERIPEDQLLEICGIGKVVDYIISGMPDKQDIFHANFKKLALPIKECADAIAKRARADFLKPSQELEFAIQKLTPRLENIAEDNRRNLRRLRDEIIQKIISDIRSQIMDAIQAGIGDNKELKNKIESVLKQERLTLEQTLQASIQKSISDTEKSVKETLEIMRMELVQGDALSIPGFTASFDHTIEVDIENGIDWTRLATSMAAGVLAVIFPAGLVLVLLGIAGALLDGWNAVASLLDSRYKKDQQKKALNSKLYLVRKELSLSVPKKMDEIADQIVRVVHSQATPFVKLSIDYNKIGQTLLDISRNLSALSKRASLISAT